MQSQSSPVALGAVLIWGLRQIGLAVTILLLATSSLTAQEEPAISGAYKIEKGTRSGWIIVTVNVPQGSHIYALTQKGNPPPTKIKLADSAAFSLLDEFKADKPPEIVEFDPIFEQRIEKHDSGKVHFMAPFRVPAGIDIEKLTFDLKFHGQICSANGCKPLFNRPITTQFGGYYEPAKQEKK